MLDDVGRSGVAEAVGADLRVVDRPWAFASEHRQAIDRHWDAARAANPRYFNGVVYLTSNPRLTRGIATAELKPAEFKAVLYWREQGFPQAGVLDGFGSALIKSADGAIVLGRQRPGHINSGLTYLPGGFIDARDVGPDGRVDLHGSVLRELEEETGLGAADGAAGPGYLIARVGPQLSFAITFRAHQAADDLVATIMARLDADPHSELQEVIAVRHLADLEGSTLPPYADLLLRRHFASS
ncbi:MAG: NUDIX domain-containing protein [Hyphomicrobium sp.]